MPDPLRALRRPQHPVPVPLGRVRDLAGAGGPIASDEPAVTGVTLDSRAVQPGDLYAALSGSRTHGARFARDAVGAGALAIITDRAGADEATDAGVPVLVAADPRAVLGELSALVYGRPAEALLMLGVTGTNGKTTTTYLLDAGLRAAGRRTGLVGTVETRVGDDAVPSVRTTPEAPDLHALLAVMRERDVTACSVEVSSHALVLGRVDGIVFDVVGFTQLGRDHLDFHGDMAAYFAAKAALFTPTRARRAVVCVDDDAGRRLAETATVPVRTLATGGGAADWTVSQRRPRPGAGADLVLTGPGGELVHTAAALPGDFNVANAALATVMLVEAGLPAADVGAGVGSTAGVPGRMERVPLPGLSVVAVVDYAHTPDAVTAALQALRPVPTGSRLVVVLGAGGDRDREKRPLMGAAAARCADAVVVTDDNPRSEDPATIRAAVLAGAQAVPAEGRAQVHEVADRAGAIALGLALAQPAGTLLVAGKGHEQGQEIAGAVHPFDDRVALRLAGAAA